MQKKTLGGERLGSGRKMEVELHGYDRSTHDLGYLWRSTMSAGTLVPFMSEVALPGDTFDIDLEVDVKTHPTVGPLFGSYKVQLDVFQAPIRLYNSYLHNNRLGIGMNIEQVKLPQISLQQLEMQSLYEITDLDNAQINPSCLLAYLGIRGVGLNYSGDFRYRKFNAVPIIAYWEIYKQYYANKQGNRGAVIHIPLPIVNESITGIEITTGGTSDDLFRYEEGAPLRTLTVGSTITVTYLGTPPTADTIMIFILAQGWVKLSDIGQQIDAGTGTFKFDYNHAAYGDTEALYWDYVNSQPGVNPVAEPKVSMFELSNIDNLREEILTTPGSTVFDLANIEYPPYTYLWGGGGSGKFMKSTQEGLAVKTYQSDLFNNWLESENIELIATKSAVSTVGDQFTIDQLNLSKKVYDMLNRVAVSGGTYDDWLDVQYGHERIQRAESPIYHGGLIRELVFQEVVSNGASEENPLGTLAGKGIMGGKRKGGKLHIRVDEPSYLIGVVSLTPRIDYSQGNKWDVHLKTIDDLHKPALDEIGFQDLITEQFAWWDTFHDGVDWVQRSAGKQPAWINYMTNVNRVYGNFAIAENEMFMTLNRRYEPDIIAEGTATIADLTTYIDPVKFNFIFAKTSIDAQNFWTQISVDMKARRKMSAKIMPNL